MPPPMLRQGSDRLEVADYGARRIVHSLAVFVEVADAVAAQDV